MPLSKPRTCHKCHRPYTGWRCPRCYRKSRKAGGSGGFSKRTFRASSVLWSVSSAPSVAHGSSDTANPYNDPRNCRHCGYLTTTHPCTYCGKD